MIPSPFPPDASFKECLIVAGFVLLTMTSLFLWRQIL